MEGSCRGAGVGATGTILMHVDEKRRARVGRDYWIQAVACRRQEQKLSARSSR